MGRSQIVSFLHVVDSRGFVTFLHVVHSRGFASLSFVEISYIMNAHQELDEILEVSSTAYINKIPSFSFTIFHVVFGFVLTLEDERSSWRHIKKYQLNLNLKIELPLVLDFNYNVGVISKNEKLKANAGFFFMVCFHIIFILMLVR